MSTLAEEPAALSEKQGKHNELIDCQRDDQRDSQDESAVSQVDWTPEEETKAKRKMDWIIMPQLALGFFCFQLDRGNIANAITDNFMEDIGITQFQFNIGQQLLFLGIVLFEIPSNMILYSVGPARWLTLQILLFGAVSTFQSWQNDYSSFLATRFLLGVTEAGYIPGGLWTIGTWYTKKETAKRVMIFYMGNQLGAASTKLIAYGVLHLRGVDGRPGWFWLFLLMGALTLLVGVLMGFCLPDSVMKPHSAFLPKYSWFTERELHILKTRILIDDPRKMEKKTRIGLKAFKRTFLNWRIWLHCSITFLVAGPFRGFDTYAPSIIRGFGYAALASNAMASVGLFLQAPFGFAFSWVSDRFNRRGETVMAGLGFLLVGYILNRALATSDNAQAKYAGIVWTQAFGSFMHALNIAWMSFVCRDSEERSLAMAMIIMAANIGALYGAQLYQASDAPRYTTAFTVCLGLVLASLTLSAIRHTSDVIQKRKEKAQSSSVTEQQQSV